MKKSSSRRFEMKKLLTIIGAILAAGRKTKLQEVRVEL